MRFQIELPDGGHVTEALLRVEQDAVTDLKVLRVDVSHHFLKYFSNLIII